MALHLPRQHEQHQCTQQCATQYRQTTHTQPCHPQNHAIPSQPSTLPSRDRRQPANHKQSKEGHVTVSMQEAARESLVAPAASRSTKAKQDSAEHANSATLKTQLPKAAIMGLHKWQSASPLTDYLGQWLCRTAAQTRPSMHVKELKTMYYIVVQIVQVSHAGIQPQADHCHFCMKPARQQGLQHSVLQTSMESSMLSPMQSSQSQQPPQTTAICRPVSH